MKTLDVSKNHDGIVVLSGFGNDHWKTAYYLNGKLYASGRYCMEEADVLAKLCRKLAKDAGYAWTERHTHIWWRLESFPEIPKTLKAYDAQTADAYRTRGASALAERPIKYLPQRITEEKDEVRTVYELAGGAPDQFDDWFYAYVQTVGSFNSKCEESVLRYRQCTGQTAPDEFNAAFNGAANDLRRYLDAVFRAPKPLDAVARRALKK